MNNVGQKFPLGQAIGEIAAQQADDADAQSGWQLPCSVVSVDGAIVTVQFAVLSGFTLPLVTMPVAGCEYFRQPIQPGCKGFAVAADARLGAMTGLGTGTADLTQPGNLGALVFVPLGNKNWFPVDPNKAVMYGPGGAIISTEDGESYIDVTPTAITVSNQTEITLAVGAVSIQITPAGIFLNGPIFFGGTVTGSPGTGGVVDMSGATQVTLPANTESGGKNIGPAHEHTGGTIGLGNTGGVV